MLGPNEVIELVGEMVQAKISGHRETLVEQIHGLLRGPRGDALNVALVLAGILAEDLGADPPGGFHRVEVYRFDPDGSVLPASVTDVPGHVALFAQMVVAVGNGDRDMARDLFIGFVGSDGSDGKRALELLVFALNEVLHANELCGCCPPDA